MRRRVMAMSVSMLVAWGGAAHGQSSDAARSAANELFADAAERTSQRAAPVFAPKMGGLVVGRYNFNYRDNPTGKEVTIGGQESYVKLNMTGNVYQEFVAYRVQIKFGEADGQPVLDDAYADFKVEDQFTIRAGQFKPPVLREENISDSKQLAANRSVMDGVFSQSRTQGVMVTYSAEAVRAMLSFNDGIRTTNLDFVAGAEADYAFTGRLEYMWDGAWKQYEEFTSFKGSSHFGAVGAALSYQEGGGTYGTNFNGATTNTDILLGTIDVMTKGDGWNLYAAAVGRTTDAPTGLTFTDFGFQVQGGWFFRPQWELFARYDVVVPDNDRTNDGLFNTISFGANKYISPDSHAVKLTLQGLWFLDPTSNGIVTQSTLAGVLTSNRRNQMAFQAQIQIAF